MKFKRRLRLMYAAGPGNIIGTYRHWKENRDDPSQVAMTYSGEFYDVCGSLDADALVISSNDKREELNDGRFQLKHRPVPFPHSQGILYHISSVLYGLRLVFEAIKFRADYVVVAEGSTHWFVLYLLRSSRHRIIPSLHSMLWLPHQRSPWTHRILNRYFFRHHAHALMSASYDITEQVNALSEGRARPKVPFLPTYRRATFDALQAPPEGSPFRVLFAGRVEPDKGVFVLLETARILSALPDRRVEFDICGTGSVIDQLRSRADELGLTATFRCHGHCSRETMEKMLGESHTVVVPTMSDSNEGFNQVVVESVLAGRPVITSVVCPAVKYVREAVFEVPPDDPKGYAEAILQLSDDLHTYDRTRAACSTYQEQFYDERNGWCAALKSIIAGGTAEYSHK